MDALPVSYAEVEEYFAREAQQNNGNVNPYPLRARTIQKIEEITGRRLICYVARTDGRLPPNAPAYIDEEDLFAFSDLVANISEPAVDILIISNGGSAEAAERIVNLLRTRFESMRWVVPFNAYSAATLLCMSGDEVIISATGTLGPIDPQINGIPARTILRAFEKVKQTLKEEGPEALTAYLPLLAKYSLHLFEICESANELSKELARKWLSAYMFKCRRSDRRVKRCVEFFISYDTHKSHSRSIDRQTAREKGPKVLYDEEIDGLPDLLRSLCNQYKWVLNIPSPIAIKLYEDGYNHSSGIYWEPPPVPAFPIPSDMARLMP